MPLAAFSALEVEHNALDAKEQEKRRVKQEQRKQKKSEVKKSTQQQLQQAGATLGHVSADAARAREQPSALAAAAASPVAGGASGMTALLQLIYAVIAYLQALLGLSPAKKKAKKRPKAAVSLGSEEQQHQPPLAASAAVVPAVSAPAPATVLPAAAAAVKAVDRGVKEGARPAATAAASAAKAPVAAVAAHPEPLQKEQAPATKHRPAAEPSSDNGHPSRGGGDGWAQGRFIVAEADGSHSDVVAAVALAGDVALTSGYDGAIKVWHWPVAGGGGYSRPEHVRNLTGHSGRIEAVSLDGAKGRAASSGRDSTLKVGVGKCGDGAGGGTRPLTWVWVDEMWPLEGKGMHKCQSISPHSSPPAYLGMQITGCAANAANRSSIMCLAPLSAINPSPHAGLGPEP